MRGCYLPSSSLESGQGEVASFDIPGCLEEGAAPRLGVAVTPTGGEPQPRDPSVHLSVCPFTPKDTPGPLLHSSLIWLQGREEVTETPPLGLGSSQSHGEEPAGIQLFPRQMEGGRGCKFCQVQGCRGPGRGRIHLVQGLGYKASEEASRRGW